MKLIRCTNCDEVFLQTPYDQWPEYETPSDVSSEVLRAVEKDDFQTFLRNHRGHLIEDLRVLEDSYVSDKPYSEPVKASYFRASNGKETFVIKKSRHNISEPLKYEVIAGDYSLRCVSIEVQSKEIEKQLKAEFVEAPCSEREVEDFIELFRRVARIADIRKLDRVAEDSTHPLEIYYKLDDTSLIYLHRNCRRIFKDKQHSRIADFIERHKEDGVLLLKATYQIQITQMARSREDSIPSSVGFRRKKLAVQ